MRSVGMTVVAAATFAVGMGAGSASAAVLEQAPKAGATVDGPVRVVVREPRLGGAALRLNGKRVALRRPDSAGRYVLRLDPTDGLRRGANVLRVTRRVDGKRFAVRRFRVAADRPLAAARDVTTSPGHGFTLDARRSSGAHGGRLRYVWTRLAAPAGSGLPKHVTGARVHLRSHALGRAAYALQVTEAPGSGTTTPTVPTSPATPTTPTSPASPTTPTTDGKRAACTTPTRTTPSANAAATDPAEPTDPAKPVDPTSTPIPAPTPAKPTDTTKPAAPCAVKAKVLVVEALIEPDLPLIPIDTQTDNGSGNPWGIRVGGTVYSNEEQNRGGGNNGAVHILALDRRTLAKVANFQVLCNRGEGDPCTQRIRAYLQSPDLANTLVIAAGHAEFVSDNGTMAAFDAIGGDPNATIGANNLYTVIGVPGMPTGTAFEAANGGPGRLTGALTQDQFGNWTYVSTDPMSFDLNTADSRAGRNVMRFNGVDYASWDYSDGTPSISLLIFDRETMQLRPDNWANNTPVDANRSDLNGLANRLNQTTEADLVVMHSVNGGPTSVTADTAAGWNAVGDAVQRIGGSKDAIIRLASGGPSASYALMGHAGLGPAQGLETTSVLTPDNPDSRITGTLTRDPSNRYGPDLASGGLETDTSLYQLAFQPAQAWPLLDTDGHRAALAWVQDVAKDGVRDGKRDDLRAEYWRTTWSEAQWLDIKSTIRWLTYPVGGVDGDGNDVGFSDQDLTDVKTELGQEITWLINVKAYFALLKQPPQETQALVAASVTKIADSIQNGLSQSPAVADSPWLSVIGEVGSFISAVGGMTPLAAPFKVLGLATSAYKVGVALTRAANGAAQSPEDQITAAAADLGVKLASDVLQNLSAMDRLQAIVVGDYGKLKALGQNANCDTSNDSCQPQWQLRTADLNQAKKLFVVQARASIYQALLPLKFGADLLQHYLRSDTNSGDVVLQFPQVRDFSCGGLDAWLRREPDSGQAQLAGYGVGSSDAYATTRYVDALAMIGREGSGTPSSDLMDPLFAPVDPNAIDSGNLGLPKTRFFLRTFGMGTPVSITWNRWLGIYTCTGGVGG
jgi:hypothetical protein